jgi:methionyl-tRNA formyltransferase
MIAEGAGRAGHWELAGILTNPDTCKGRGGGSTPTEVGRLAALLAEEWPPGGSGNSGAEGLTEPPAILKFETLKAEAREAVSALGPDLLVSFAYGRIFGPRFLALFPLGGINVHPSLLPKYRGASPIQEAILRRDSQTGITVQRIAAEMDTGNILAQETIPLTGRETTASLSEIAAVRGAALLQAVLEQFCQAKHGGHTSQETQAEFPVTGPEGIPQRGEPSYCTMLEKNSGLIDWNRSALEIDAHIRAFNPWPLARTGHNGQTLNILEAAPYTGPAPCCTNSVNMLDISGACPGNGGPSALPDTAALAGPAPCCTNSVNMLDVSHACPGRVLGIDKKSGILIQTGEGILAVSLLQYQTRKALPWQAFLNGARDFIGSRLSGGS